MYPLHHTIKFSSKCYANAVSFTESSHIGNYGASISTLQAKAALEQNQQHLRAKTTPFQ